MFHVASHDEGFAVEWNPGDDSAAEELRLELMLDGLQRGREWTGGFVVLQYRNRLETLDALIRLLGRLNISFSLDPALSRAQALGDAERRLIDAISLGTIASPEVQSDITEFTSGRRLLPYQVDAVQHHLMVQNSAEFSVPGAGKTTVALAYWALVKREIPDIGIWVIGPLSCFRPWEDEIEACFSVSGNSLRIRGTAQERDRQLQQARFFDLVLCSYHTAWRETSAIERVLQARPWLLVLDESHYIKSMTGALSASVRRLAPFAARRLVLTGTPMPRAPEDLWSQFTFLWPTESLLGNSQQHSDRCRRSSDAVCEELRDVLGPFFHRTCKSDLRLPEVDSSYPEIANAPASQRLLIRLIERKTAQESVYLRSNDIIHLRRWRRARLIRLLQASSNPLLLAEALDPLDVIASDEDDPDVTASDPEFVPLSDIDSDLATILARYATSREVSGKAQYVAQRVRELAASGRKVVVWTVFLGNVDLLASMLHELEPLCITGRVPAYDAEDETGEATRESRIELFKTDPSRRVLIANAAACSESISLHRVCQHAIYLERSFNAAQFIQSLDRIHRQGMPAGTTAHVEIPYLPCAVERVLNRRLLDRQRRLYRLLNDPMPIIGFDDESQAGMFDAEDDHESIDSLFDEVLGEIRTNDDN